MKANLNTVTERLKMLYSNQSEAGAKKTAIIQNLIACNVDRNPTISAGSVVVANNYVYCVPGGYGAIMIDDHAGKRKGPVQASMEHWDDYSNFLKANGQPSPCKMIEHLKPVFHWTKILLFLSFLCLLPSVMAEPNESAEKSNKAQAAIKVNTFYNPNMPESPSTKRLIKLMRKDPRIRIKTWGGIVLPGGGSKASLMMSIAGETAPDIGLSWFHIIRNEMKEGFLSPMNEWIGEDKNNNGQIDLDEATWSGWKEIKPLLRRVATLNGKVYGIPLAKTHIIGIVYRVDMVSATGLNPNLPPRTWDELIYWCQKLTDPRKNIPGATIQKGQRGIALSEQSFHFLPWIHSQGADPIIQIKTSPKTGKKFTFSSDATSFITPDGENLLNSKSEWRANFASKEGLKALDLIYKLRWMKWLLDPETREPVNLSKEDISNGYAMVDKRKIEFSPKEIIVGCARAKEPSQRNSGKFELLSRGEVALAFNSVLDLTKVADSTGIDPNLLSWMPYPAGPGKKSQRVVQIQNHYVVMYEGVKNRPKAERDLIWKTVLALTDQQSRDNEVIQKVLMGYSRFAPPKDLKRLGYEEYIRDIPAVLKQNFADIESGKIGVYTEPWSGFWYSVGQTINNKVLGLLLANNGEDFDYKTALIDVQKKANSGVMFAPSKEVLDNARPYARIIFSLIVIFTLIFVFLIIRAQLKRNKEKKSSIGSVYSGWFAWSLIVPALFLIAVWSYYPLLRGAVMAFQDYKITGDSPFIGLDNFIILAMDYSFWMSLLRTGYFVILNMLFAFTAPILLAILLTEVPKFKLLFRTLFFLPQMTSGLVIILLWRLMYSPNPQGFFNQLISYLNYIPFVDIGPQIWLQDPKLAMICCVLPTAWASMGMASLIYLAALKSIPEDLYEAAEVDGASMISKLTYITIPTILPLIIINFVGAFIATFQNMGSILLLTFGGPGEATTVVGLKIWIEAYTNLRFSMATSMAWILGSLLIGFTYVQIKFLSKIEYRRVQD